MIHIDESSGCFRRHLVAINQIVFNFQISLFVIPDGESNHTIHI
jgi:hypothetical protein